MSQPDYGQIVQLLIEGEASRDLTLSDALRSVVHAGDLRERSRFAILISEGGRWPKYAEIERLYEGLPADLKRPLSD